MFAEMEKGGRYLVYEHVERIRLISELALGAQGESDRALALLEISPMLRQRWRELVDFIHLIWRLHR